MSTIFPDLNKSRFGSNICNNPLERLKPEEEKGPHQNLGSESYPKPDLGFEPESGPCKQPMEAEALAQDKNTDLKDISEECKLSSLKDYKVTKK